MSKKIQIVGLFIILTLVLVGFLLYIVKIKNTPKINSKLIFSGEKNTTKDILILDDPLDTKSIIFENERVVITFGAEDFKSSLKGFIAKYSDDAFHIFIKEDKELITFIEGQSLNNDSISISDAKNNLQIRAKFRIADLLEIGKCKIFDKKEKNYLKEILFEKWSDYSGSGRRYIIPKDNFIFFDTIDTET